MKKLTRSASASKPAEETKKKTKATPPAKKNPFVATKTKAATPAKKKKNKPATTKATTPKKSTASASSSSKQKVAKKEEEEAEAETPPPLPPSRSPRAAKKPTDKKLAAVKKNDAPTPTTAPDPDSDPKWAQRREAMRQLFDDIRIAQDFSAKKGYLARFEKQEQAKQLWSTFLRETTQRVRTMQVSPDVDLQTLMATVEKGELALDPRAYSGGGDPSRGNCLRHCRYVGRATRKNASRTRRPL